MTAGGVPLDAEDPKSPDLDPNVSEDLGDNPEIEKFFHRLPASLRWPKPSPEALAAATEAVQRMSTGPGQEESLVHDAFDQGRTCGGCGAPLGEGMRFCGHCGLAIAAATAASEAVPAAGQHHYHHHYHHFLSPLAAAPPPAQGAGQNQPRGRAATSAVTGVTSIRAQNAVRQLVQDWAQACNNKHLDDLLELYVPDATVVRANVQPVRSLPAIREFFFSLLEAGLGDVEMESLRTEIYGEIAFEMGRCKMLVPVVMGKRREERGKYLLLMARQAAGNWKIVADSWTTDLSVAAPEVVRKAGEPGIAASVKKPR
jgi:uncharacterized protein (TIGR02246 family)